MLYSYYIANNQPELCIVFFYFISFYDTSFPSSLLFAVLVLSLSRTYGFCFFLLFFILCCPFSFSLVVNFIFLLTLLLFLFIRYFFFFHENLSFFLMCITFIFCFVCFFFLLLYVMSNGKIEAKFFCVLYIFQLYFRVLPSYNPDK